MPEYLRAKDAADRLGVSVETLARWRVIGSPLPFAKLGRIIVYDVVDLDAYVAACKVRSTAVRPAAPVAGRAHRSGSTV